MKRRKHIFLVGITMVMFGFLLVILFGDNGYLELSRLKAEYQQLNCSQARLKQENAQLHRAIDRLKEDPAFIESIARRELGMIRPNELVFTFKGHGKND